MFDLLQSLLRTSMSLGVGLLPGYLLVATIEDEMAEEWNLHDVLPVWMQGAVVMGATVTLLSGTSLYVAYEIKHAMESGRILINGISPSASWIIDDLFHGVPLTAGVLGAVLAFALVRGVRQYMGRA